MVEALLFVGGGTSRLGKVDDGNTTSDYELEEVKRGDSIQTSVLPCAWKDHKLNLLDTPGYPDFVGEVTSGLRAADAAVLVITAQSGVEVGTEDAWELCEEAGVPRLVLINKMDRENADFQRTLENIQDVFERRCVAIQVPVGAEQSLKGVVSLLEPPGEASSDVVTGVEELRERLVEAVAESDDDLATRYLEGETITQEELSTAVKRGVLSGEIVPVMVGSATAPVGVEELLDAMVELLPSPADLPDVVAADDDSKRLAADAAGPLAAIVFKTIADPFVGKVSYFRVVSGTMKSDSRVWNSSKGVEERIGQLFIVKGKSQDTVDSLGAGDIGSVAKLSDTGTGDTLCQREDAVVLEGVRFPEPLFTSAISPKGKADLDKMASSLSRLVEEDPTLQVSRAARTGETLLSGMGETHIDVAVEKAKRKFGVELINSLPKVAYQETISATTRTEYRHKKQSGGHGQYGHVKIELAPLPRGGGFEFDAKVVGGNVPKEYIPAVEKGVVKSLDEGVLGGYPIVDLKVVLYDGSSHPVDSSGMSFEIAGSFALRKGVEEATPVLLEQVMHLQATIPDASTGEVIGDLNVKRAKILGMTPQGGMTVIEAEVPQGEMLRYATDLRSIPQGRGRFVMEFAHYEGVPEQLTRRIVEGSKQTAEV
jgi:elongation factor G